MVYCPIRHLDNFREVQALKTKKKTWIPDKKFRE